MYRLHTACLKLILGYYISIILQFLKVTCYGVCKNMQRETEVNASKTAAQWMQWHIKHKTNKTKPTTDQVVLNPKSERKYNKKIHWGLKNTFLTHLKYSMTTFIAWRVTVDCGNFARGVTRWWQIYTKKFYITARKDKTYTLTRMTGKWTLKEMDGNYRHPFIKATTCTHIRCLYLK